jgi:manganese oxidase
MADGDGDGAPSRWTLAGAARPSRRRVLHTVTTGGALALAAPQADVAPARRLGRVREYWIKAESFWHNLVPNGRDGMMGTTFNADQTTIWALGYRAYTPHWGRLLAGNDSIGPNTGIPGPTLRAEVGDTITVHFQNNDAHYRFPHSIHAHGVTYAPDSDGAWLAANPTAPGTAVGYGQTYTYTFRALPSSVGTWPYHDHSQPRALSPNGDPTAEIGAQLGMFGVIAITGPTTPRADREFVLFFHDLYADDVPTLAGDIDCFNGRAYIDNTPTYTAKVGERVRWRVAALGKEFHAFHVHGHRWYDGTRHVDAQILGPSTTLTVDYVEDNPGDWLYHCHVTDHMMGGMVGRYQVTP